MKKHICMVAYTRYSVDNRVRREAEALATQPGNEITVLVPKEGDRPRSYELAGVKIAELNLKKIQAKSILRYITAYLNFSLRTFLLLNHMLFIRKLDVIHVHNMPDFLVFTALIPRLCGKTVILDIHDSMPETYLAKYQFSKRWLQRLFCWEEAISCKFVQKVISVNHPQKDALIKRGLPVEKVIVCMNVPDENRFKLNKNLKKRTNNQFRLIYHGTQTKRLGVDLVIQSMARLVDKIPGLQFHVIGDGDDLSEFISLTSELQLNDHIFFSRKHVPAENLVEILPTMDLGVVANRRNIATDLMLPVKMLEYIALDIPVVAPDLKTIRHYFSDEMVSFFKPGNIDSLATKIHELFIDKEKRKKQAKAARSFLDQYSWENHKNVLMDLYNNLN